LIEDEENSEISAVISTKKQSAFVRFLKNIFPWKGDKLSAVVLKIVFILAIVTLIFSLEMIYIYFFGEKKVDETFEKTNSIYSQEPVSIAEESKPEPQMLDNFVELYKLNPDIVGWIEIPDTAISYPVLQTTDNAFYLDHDFEKAESKAGAIFADFRLEISKDGLPLHTVLYGHDMKAGTFFAQLNNYKKLDFMKTHNVVEFNTLYENQKWEIFACFLTSVNASQDGGVLFDYHNKLDLSTADKFDEFYKNVMMRSYYLTDVDVTFGDEILTLSTCSNEFYDSRFVVMARKVRPNETPANNTEKIVENPDRYMPLVWYEAKGLTPPR